jgi:hypothetical protein
MAGLLTRSECQALFREEVKLAGGAKKWLKKNKIWSLDHVTHMVSDGSYFTHSEVMAALGLKSVERWETVSPPQP